MGARLARKQKANYSKLLANEIKDIPEYISNDEKTKIFYIAHQLSKVQKQAHKNLPFIRDIELLRDFIWVKVFRNDSLIDSPDLQGWVLSPEEEVKGLSRTYRILFSFSAMVLFGTYVAFIFILMYIVDYIYLFYRS